MSQDNEVEATEWPEWLVVFNDERGSGQVKASDIVLDDGIWVFWRGKDAFLRVPATSVISVTGPGETS